VDDYAIQGVVCHTLRVCPLFDIETMHIERELKRRGVPCLVLSTDYSLEDVAQIRNRVEAFVEMIAAPL
jgi:benzoyl-CoA reductase/2-hydroxyglutaryl-CoA dehydratase subunit BcrC/BadD/HgdB